MVDLLSCRSYSDFRSRDSTGGLIDCAFLCEKGIQLRYLRFLAYVFIDGGALECVVVWRRLNVMQVL